MASTLDPAPWLVAWIEGRVADLDGKVFPHSAPQAGRTGSDTPYCLYSEVHFEPAGAMNSPGRTGLALVVYQVDVVSRDRDEATAIANAITGTAESPGLDRFRGLMSRAGADDLYVQCARLARPGSADEWEPEHGQAQGEYRVSRDYEVWFNEKLQPA